MFWCRSQTDIDKSETLAETEGFQESLVLCKSLHTSLEYLTGEIASGFIVRRGGDCYHSLLKHTDSRRTSSTGEETEVTGS